MNFQRNKLIYTKCKEKGLSFKHVCEIGVYLPATSNIIDFIFENIKTSLVEPDSNSISAINEFFKNQTNITLFPFAMYDNNGTVKLSQASASTFISDLKASPALVNDHFKVTDENSFEVPCRMFSEVDSGDIDLLSIDIEGAEWYVLKYMTSRPLVISIETHGKSYQNPFLNEIQNWIDDNNYEVWFKDLSDTVFVKKGVINFTFSERVSILLKTIHITWRRFKKKLYFWK